MANHPNRSRAAQKLPNDVYYTARNGGMYVRWDGRPEGQVSYTYDRSCALGHDDAEFEWTGTPYQGASGSCRRAEVVRLAAEYSK